MFDPNDPNRIILAGDSSYSYKLLLVSTDRGVTWPHTGDGLIEPVYCLAVAPSVAGLFFAGTSQGLFLSRDGGNNWSRTGTFTSVRAVCVCILTTKTSSMLVQTKASILQRMVARTGNRLTRD
ncbi:MAG: WD40/YVTN/BNR-like repeat-containing protein [bacterium]